MFQQMKLSLLDFENLIYQYYNSNTLVLITNYRLFHWKNNTFYIMPVKLIEDMSIVESDLLIKIISKLGFYNEIKFMEVSHFYYCCYVLEQLVSQDDDFIASDIYLRKTTLNNSPSTPQITNHPPSRDNFSCFFYEMKHLQLTHDPLWKISDVNTDFLLCDTYPQLHIFPSSIPNSDIQLLAEYRVRQRFISLSWRDPINGTTLLRSGQPYALMIAIYGCEIECDLLNYIRSTNINSSKNGKLIIIDARPTNAALMNYAKGGGTEAKQNYNFDQIEFLGIENIHTLRESFAFVKYAMMNESMKNSSINQLYGIESFKLEWLKQIKTILDGAVKTMNHLNNGNCVLVHCSDGWDRTTQINSLVKILVDPFYRTIVGFSLLIQRDWLEFGHKFKDRCSNLTNETSEEYSPIFLIFLDSVHQLLLQFPKCFEYNENFLIKLAIHSHCPLFGTFLYNDLKTRIQKSISNRTLSFWDIYNEKCKIICNPNYEQSSPVENPSDKTIPSTKLEPKTQIEALHFWNTLYNGDIFRINAEINGDLYTDFENVAPTFNISIIKSAQKNRTQNGSIFKFFELFTIGIETIMNAVSSLVFKWDKSQINDHHNSTIQKLGNEPVNHASNNLLHPIYTDKVPFPDIFINTKSQKIVDNLDGLLLIPNNS